MESKTSRLGVILAVTTLASFALSTLTFFGVHGDQLPLRWRSILSSTFLALGTAAMIGWVRVNLRERILAFRHRRRVRKALYRQWPKFTKSVRKPEGFLRRGNSRSIYRVVEATNPGLRRDVEQSLIIVSDLARCMPELASNIRPEEVLQARPIVGLYEQLLTSLERLGVLNDLHRAEMPDHWLSIRDTFLGDYAAHLRSYREFSEQANEDIGEFVFGGLLP